MSGPDAVTFSVWAFSLCEEQTFRPEIDQKVEHRSDVYLALLLASYRLPNASGLTSGSYDRDACRLLAMG